MQVAQEAAPDPPLLAHAQSRGEHHDKQEDKDYEDKGGDVSGVNEVFKDSNWANRGPSLRWWRTLTSLCNGHNCIRANISLLKPGKYWSQLKILGQDQVLVMTENESYEDCSVSTHPIEFDTF